MPPRIDIIPAEETTAAQAHVIAALERVAFPPPSNPYTWHNPGWHTLVWLEDRLVSYLGLHARTCTVGGRPVRLGGIGGVMTDPAFRKQGYSSLALRAAAAFMRDDIGADFGLLLTGTALIPFYERLGWRPVDGPLTFSQPQGTAFTWDEVIMILPLRGQAWPAGPIALGGLPW